MKIAIIGLGNTLFTDEGIGTRFVHCISNIVRDEYRDMVHVYPLETKILDIITIVQQENYDKIIIIDSGNIENRYEIYRISDLDNENIEELKSMTLNKYSHSFSIIDIALYLKMFSKNCDIYLILFKPENLKMLDKITEKCVSSVIEAFRKILQILNIEYYFEDRWDCVYRCVISSQDLQEFH